MHPILFKLGPITVYTYGVMLALGFVVAVLLAARRAKEKQISPQKIIDLGLVVIISGIIGARIVHVLSNLGHYRAYPWEIVMLQRGGLAIHGALFLAIPSGIIFIRRQKLPLAQTLDLAVPFVALGQAIGRIGCFFNGCCYGVATDSILAMRFPQLPQSVHPVQLYSSLALLLIYMVLRVLEKSRHSPGDIFIAYGLFYSAARFFIDFIRGDLEVFFWGLRLTQLLSLVFFALFLLFFSLKRVIVGRKI